ncbi:inositol 1,4,5-triphosphate receptor associated 2-like isoform X2 [Bacillus rossius redtenbacheri]
MQRGPQCPVEMAGSSGANAPGGAPGENTDQDGVDIACRRPKTGIATPQPSSTTNPVQEATGDDNVDRTSEVAESKHSENGSDAITEETSDIFPSLSDPQLASMGLLPLSDQPVSEVLTEQDVENRYTSLSLAFKTDKVTLRQRFDLQHRQRDQAEKNMQAEVERLKAAVQKLNRLCVDSESADILTQIQSQVHVLQQSTEQVSNSAEMFGAVQQEQRLSKAVEVMLAHVDNLKRVYEKEHSELEETRRLLTENKIVLGDSTETDDPASRGRHRSIQTLTGAGKIASQPGAKRRASIAVPQRSPGSSDSLRGGISSSYLADIKSRFGSSTLRRRPSLNPAQPSATSETPPAQWDSADRLDKTDSSGMDEIEELSESRRESATSTQEPKSSDELADGSVSAFVSSDSSIIMNGNGVAGGQSQELEELVHFSLDSEQEHEEEEEDEDKHHRAPAAFESVYRPLDCVW